MKTLYSFITIALLSTGAMAQDFVYASGQHRIDTVLNENYESYEIQVVTPTPENITFKWEMVSNSFDPNWSCSVCDYSGCYVGFPPSATMTAITAAEMSAGTNGFIKVNITCGLNYGDGKVEIYVYDATDYTRGDTVSFYIHWPAPATAVQENEIEFSLYPNPVEDVLTINNASNIEGTVKLTDMLGKVVRKESINALATKEIDLRSMKAGVYIVSIRDQNGSLSTKKILKQ